MKKIIIIVCLIILLVIIVVLNLHKEEKVLELPEYPGNYKCEIEGIEELEDDEKYYQGNVYLVVEDGYVMSAVYQNITDDRDSALVDAIIKLYKGIDGIKISYDSIDEVSVLTIEHDYTKISLEQIKEQLGDLLGDDSLFIKYDELPISFDEYKLSELEGYNCYEN